MARKDPIQESNHQRITLTAMVHGVILEDMKNFLPKVNYGGFINQVILGMMDDQRVNIEKALDDGREKYQRQIERIQTDERVCVTGGDTPVATLAQALAEWNDESNIQEFRRIWSEDLQEPGRKGLNILLHRSVCKELEDRQSNWIGDHGEGRFKNRKEFLEALLYYYATLPGCERERVVYHSEYKMLLRILRADCGMRSSIIVTLRSKDGKKEQPERFHVVPGALDTDAQGTHYYLAGLSMPYGGETKEAIYASIRLTNIEDIKDRDQGLRMSAEQDRSLREEIRQKGIEFIWNGHGREERPIRVRLTEKSYWDYRTRVRSRPRIQRDHDGKEMIEPMENGDVILTLDCSKFQAELYFTGFGADAEILEPQSLREQMMEKYRRAYELYSGGAST